MRVSIINDFSSCQVSIMITREPLPFCLEKSIINIRICFSLSKSKNQTKKSSLASLTFNLLHQSAPTND